MPNCYVLIPKGGNKPEKLAIVDDKMCEHFNVIPDRDLWYCDWENTIGLCFAMGYSEEKIRDIFKNEHKIYTKILDWIYKNYTVNAWYETRRR